MRHETLSPAELKSRTHKLLAQASGIRDQAELDRILLSFQESARAQALIALKQLAIAKCPTCKKAHQGLSFTPSEVTA